MKYLLVSVCFTVIPIAIPAQIDTAIAIIGGSLVMDRAGSELRDTIDHAEAAAHSLLGRADDIAKARIQQIDTILKETVNRIIGQSEDVALRVIGEATSKLRLLEREIIADVKKMIWEVECGTRRLALEDLDSALGGLGDLLGTNQISLTPPVRVLETPKWWTGCLWWCKDPYVIDIKEPFGETYIEVRNLMEEAIASDIVNDDTPANDIVGTYEYLSAFALRASCFYQGSEDRYNREFVKYQEAARQWNSILKVELQ